MPPQGLGEGSDAGPPHSAVGADGAVGAQVRERFKRLVTRMRAGRSGPDAPTDVGQPEATGSKSSESSTTAPSSSSGWPASPTN